MEASLHYHIPHITNTEQYFKVKALFPRSLINSRLQSLANPLSIPGATGFEVKTFAKAVTSVTRSF